MPISKLTFREVDAIFTSLDSTATRLQKEQAWKRYAGQRVRWTGEIRSIDDGIGGLAMQIRHKRQTIGSDVFVRLRPDQKTKALKYSKGQRVTYSGVLADYGEVLVGIVLEHGAIEE